MKSTVPGYPVVRHAGQYAAPAVATAAGWITGCIVHGLPAQDWTSAGHLVVILVIVVLVPAVWGDPERRQAALAVLDRLMRWRC
jgi:hypothetical protein